MNALLAAALVSVRILSHDAATRAELRSVGVTTALEAAGASALRAGGAPVDLWKGRAGHWTIRVEGGAPRDYDGALLVRAEEGRLVFTLSESLEDYVGAVVASETTPGTPRAALEAQAIVARSYALASPQRHEGAMFCDLAHCQVLRGDGVSASHLAASRAAALATAGRVLRLASGKIAAAPFHASCGGHTADPVEVFGGDDTGAAAVDDPGCPLSAWSARVPRATFERATRDLFLRGARLPATLSVQQLELVRGAGGSVVRVVEPGGAAASGDAFSRALDAAMGFGAVRSARFEMTISGEGIRLDGAGLGHGAGLCQAGAALRARQGSGTETILRHYFPRATVAQN